MMSKGRERMRAAILTTVLVAVVAVGTLGLWHSPIRDITQISALLGVTRAKPALESVATPGKEVVAGSSAKTGPSADEEAHPNGEAERAHAEGTAASEAVDRKEEGAKGESHQEGVELTPAQIRDSGIELMVASGGSIGSRLERPAEVKFNGDRVVHVVSRVEGVVSEVTASQGENIKKGAIMAVLNSRELAELKANYLAAFERRNLARETFERERRLWEKKISSEKDYLEAKTALAEADIAVRAAGQKLKALGFSDELLTKFTRVTDIDLTTYTIVAPISGTIVERHISLGEAVSTEKEVFVVADLSTVWIDIAIYAQDLSLVRAGQSVTIDPGDGKLSSGKIAFVTPQMHEQTRTAVARVITDSDAGRLKPGMFVKAQIEAGQETAGVRVRKSTIQNYQNGPVVFIREGDKFEPRPVKLGRENTEYAEILSGLSVGETYVAEGAFTLKAQLLKASLGEGHGH